MVAQESILSVIAHTVTQQLHNRAASLEPRRAASTLAQAQTQVALYLVRPFATVSVVTNFGLSPYRAD